MAKTYIDVPVIGYETWLLSSGYFNNDGHFVEDEDAEDISFEDLRRRFPYEKSNPHIH